MQTVTIIAGTPIHGASRATSVMSTVGIYLIDNLGNFIVDNLGNYINLGGGIPSGVGSTSVPYANASVSTSTVTVGTGTTEVSWVLGG